MIRQSPSVPRNGDSLVTVTPSNGDSALLVTVVTVADKYR
jgi:hypothetical protein